MFAEGDKVQLRKLQTRQILDKYKNGMNRAEPCFPWEGTLSQQSCCLNFLCSSIGNQIAEIYRVPSAIAMPHIHTKHPMLDYQEATV